jgi:hypothetical protein
MAPPASLRMTNSSPPGPGVARGALGPDADRLGRIAREHGVWLVIGVNEPTRSARDALQLAPLLLALDGELALHHRKLVPTNHERLVWGPGDGRGLRAIETPLGRLGGLICWENYMPLARFSLYESGVEIYVAPTPCPARSTVSRRNRRLPRMRPVTAQKLDGKATSAAIKDELKVGSPSCASAGIVPGLGTVLVGDDPGSRWYVNAKHKDCAEVGINSIRVDLPADRLAGGGRGGCPRPQRGPRVHRLHRAAAAARGTSTRTASSA